MAISKCGSFTEGKGYRRTIGVKVGQGGKLLPCRWWLGLDKPTATAKALQIEALWVGLNAPYWSPEALAVAEGIRVGATATNAPELKSTPIAVKPQEILTVAGLIERFRQAKLNDARLSQPSKHSISCRTKSLEKSPIASMPLASVGAEQLEDLVSYWLNKPNNGKGEPISDYSARMIVKTARAVFDWADAVGLWIAPRRFDRLFKLPRASCQPTFQTFSPTDLMRLYKHATTNMRTMILLSLNCGFCSSELATLKRGEIDLKGKVIKRARQKTMVEMQWPLWDETAKALRKSMACEGDLALTTDGGKPLVWYSDKGHRVDILPNRWERLLKSANETLKKHEKPICGSFKTLRKTGATMIRAIGGIEVSEMYLAHSEKSMAKFYSTPSQPQLTKALTALRKQLAPMFAV